MQKIDPKTISLDEAKKITLQNGNLLYKQEDAYAFLPEGFAKPTFAFESEMMTCLLITMAAEIVDIEILNLISEAASPELEVDYEIRLVLRDDTKLVIDSASMTYRIVPVPERRKSTQLASEVWGLEGVAPYNRILVTDSAIKRIAQNFGEMEPAEALHELWNEFVDTSQSTPGHDIHRKILVRSLCGDFLATEHLCGRVAFTAHEKQHDDEEIPF